MIQTINVMQFGADATGSVSSTAALQRAIDACAESGGGRVLFPPGVYLTGTLWMRSNVTLEVEAGATLAAHAEVAAFPIWHSKWEGKHSACHESMITGEGL